MTDLSKPGVATALVEQIKSDIDQYCIEAYDTGHRKHLGASQIGKECKRQIWYEFRWCFTNLFDKDGNTPEENQANYGRMMRLFQRGHFEEPRFVERLRGIGAEVWEHDENGDQFRVSAVEGHFGGSLDGVARLPERYGVEKPVLLEFKTMSTKAFPKLVKNGVAVEKPVYYAQFSVYGYFYDFDYVLFMVVDKNDDSLHIELCKINKPLGKQMVLKAEQIITSQEPPPRISDDPTFWNCKMCPAYKVCFQNAPVEKNCRACKFGKPAANKSWFCTFHEKTIPDEVIPVGCDQYEPIVNG